MNESLNIKDREELWNDQVGNTCIIGIPERDEKRGETKTTLSFKFVCPVKKWVYKLCRTDKGIQFSALGIWKSQTLKRYGKILSVYF